MSIHSGDVREQLLAQHAFGVHGLDSWVLQRLIGDVAKHDDRRQSYMWGTVRSTRVKRQLLYHALLAAATLEFLMCLDGHLEPLVAGHTAFSTITLVGLTRVA